MIEIESRSWWATPRIRIMPAMFAPKIKAGLVVRRLVASALVLWLAGVGCFFGCEMSASAAPSGEHQASAKEKSCPAFSGDDCCDKAESGDDDQTESSLSSEAPTIRQTPAGPGVMTCCPLTGQSADPPRKMSIRDAPVAEAGKKSTPTPNNLTSTQTSTHRLRVPDRGSTHLRCCVFLI